MEVSFCVDEASAHTRTWQGLELQGAIHVNLEDREVRSQDGLWCSG